MIQDATLSSASTSSESVASRSTATFKKQDNEVFWPSIGNKHQIPGWLRDNVYIFEGHPMPTYSYQRSFRLWCCWHMETMNIWTHLLGSMAFVTTGFILYRYTSTPGSLDIASGDKFTFSSFVAAATICFGLSTTFHTLRSHSYNVYHFWGRMDILGICVLAFGAGMSMTYYAFYYRLATQRLYWGLIFCSALAGAITLFDTGGGGSKMRSFRGRVFFLLGLSAMFPIFHRASQLGWSRACTEIGAGWYLAEALSLLVGVSLFAFRIPERLSPGSFDIWGHSHQLFHTCAVLGGAFHVIALISGYNYRQAYPNC